MSVLQRVWSLTSEILGPSIPTTCLSPCKFLVSCLHSKEFTITTNWKPAKQTWSRNTVGIKSNKLTTPRLTSYIQPLANFFGTKSRIHKKSAFFKAMSWKCCFSCSSTSNGIWRHIIQLGKGQVEEPTKVASSLTSKQTEAWLFWLSTNTYQLGLTSGCELGLTFIMLCCDLDAALLEHVTKSHLSQALYLIGDVKLNSAIWTRECDPQVWFSWRHDAMATENL